jgi:hypothetical protein
MSVFAFIALGLVDWSRPKAADPSFGSPLLVSLWQMLSVHAPVPRMRDLVPWLFIWPVASGVVGWCLHTAAMVFYSRFEKAPPFARCLIVLGALCVLLFSCLLTHEWYSASSNYNYGSLREHRREFAYRLIQRLPRQHQTPAHRFYSERVENQWSIPVPFNPTNGPWIVLEEAMAGFAKSNGIEILSFRGAATPLAQVVVRHKDLAAMSRFVRSMGQSANKAGAASPSWAAGSETNRTSAGAGPGG